MAENSPEKIHGPQAVEKVSNQPPPSLSEGTGPASKEIFSSKKHSMEYVTVEGVKLRTGYYDKKDWYLLIIKELLDNSVDEQLKAASYNKAAEKPQSSAAETSAVNQPKKSKQSEQPKIKQPKEWREYCRSHPEEKLPQKVESTYKDEGINNWDAFHKLAIKESKEQLPKPQTATVGVQV